MSNGHRVQLFSPHPGPLPKGEGEPTTDFRRGCTGDSSKLGATWLPLPEGEGRGEGERNERSPTKRFVRASIRLLVLWRCLLAFLVPLSACAGMLEVNFTPLPDGTVVNLSTEGPLDWVHWGLTSPLDLNRLSGVVPLIPNLSLIGVAPLESTNGLAIGFAWTNGAPTLEASNATRFAFVRGLSNGRMNTF